MVVLPNQTTDLIFLFFNRRIGCLVVIRHLLYHTALGIILGLPLVHFRIQTVDMPGHLFDLGGKILALLRPLTKKLQCLFGLSLGIQYPDIVKGTSLDTRHDLKLSFPPSDFSKTDDPVSLTYEGCYKAVGYYTAIINASPELKTAFIEAMAQHGIDADNCNELLKREWDIWAYLLSLPEIAKLTKSMPAYEDYNRSKPENRSLISAARKIEHTKNGAIVEKVSIETGGPKDENGKATPLEIASSDDMVAEITDRIMVQQCLSLLSETDREILIRHANGETYAALANAYGYKTAGGMQKRIVRIKKQVANRMGIDVE